MDKMEGGHAQAHLAYSRPPGSSPTSLLHLASSSTPSLQPLLPPPPLPNVPAAVASLLLEFPDVVNCSKQQPVSVHDVQHHIKTVGPPLASRSRCLEGAKLQAARAEFNQMEKDSMLFNQPLGIPLHMALGSRAVIFCGSRPFEWVDSFFLKLI